MARTTTKRSATEAIVAVLRRGPQRGLTAATISERAGINLNTVRTTLGTLVSTETVFVVGRQSPTRGRPSNLYRIADAT